MAGGAQTAQSFARHQRIRIFGSDDHFRDSGGDQRIGAGPVRPVWAQGSSVT